MVMLLHKHNAKLQQSAVPGKSTYQVIAQKPTDMNRKSDIKHDISTYQLLTAYVNDYSQLQNIGKSTCHLLPITRSRVIHVYPKAATR